MAADFRADGGVGAGHATRFVFVCVGRGDGLAAQRLGIAWGLSLSIGTTHATLEVVHEADARLTLEGTRLDVLLGNFEAGEIAVVFVLGDAGVADSSALTGKGQSAHGQYADQTKHAGQDRTGHQIVLLRAGGALLHLAREHDASPRAFGEDFS